MSKEQSNPNEFYYTPFPTNEFPQTVRAFINAGAKCTGVDQAMVALPTIAALGATIGNALQIQINDNWCQPSIFWAGVVGESGSGKSPAMKLALSKLQQIQGDAFVSYECEREQYELASDEYNRKLKEWEKTNRNPEHKPTLEPEPICKRYLTSEATTESLVKIMSFSDRGILIAVDELSGWIKSMDKYRNGKGGDLEFFLQGFDGSPVIRDRVSEGHAGVYIPHGGISVCGTIQPKIFQDIMRGNLTENGFVARMLIAKPPEINGRWNDSSIGTRTRDDMHRLFDRLNSLPERRDERNRLIPTRIPLGIDARKIFRSYMDDHLEKRGFTPPADRAIASKMTNYCARFALLLCAVRNCEQGDLVIEKIDGESMASAVRLANWFYQEAQRVHGLSGVTVMEQERDRLVEAIANRYAGMITARELSRMHRKYGTADQSHDVLKRLEKAGYGTIGYSDTGGRPSCVFAIGDRYLSDEKISERIHLENELLKKQDARLKKNEAHEPVA